MREIPHPIFVVAPFPLQLKGPSGLLVSSFNTVTLNPTPYVSFNIKTPSSNYSAIHDSGQFLVYPIFDSSTYHLYAGRKNDDVIEEMCKRQILALRKSPWYLRCKLLRNLSVVVSDHKIVVGKVVSINSQAALPAYHASFHWRQNYRQFWPSEVYTSVHFKHRLRDIQIDTDQSQIQLNKILNRVKDSGKPEELKRNLEIPAAEVGVEETDHA